MKAKKIRHVAGGANSASCQEVVDTCYQRAYKKLIAVFSLLSART